MLVLNSMQDYFLQLMIPSCGWIDDDVIEEGTEMILAQPLSYPLSLYEDGKVLEGAAIPENIPWMHICLHLTLLKPLQ